jgi:formate dehydrogenase major subunit
MSQIALTINGRTILSDSGKTILQISEQEGIFIPTLCHHPLLKPEEACRICVVEVKGSDKLVASCSTPAADGMVIRTDSAAVLGTRRLILELLLQQHYGDCLAPCQLTCPARIDIQGYLAFIAHGQYLEALKLIKERNPLPQVVGRVCPHPCEDACRRNRVEEPLAINPLKRFVADYAWASGLKAAPEIPPPSGHRVAIVGSGPGGLAAAYYLRTLGHGVTIFEAKPLPGGMLRYSIPEYRLPKKILDEEIQGIKDLGVEIRCRQALGRDFILSQLRTQGYEAVFLALGAWRSTQLGLAGEDLPGIVTGLDFLLQNVQGRPPDLGPQVLVIGGGNAAMDAARTALRLGAEKVSLLYRRSRKEMPAHREEVAAAEEEGVRMDYLVSPTRLVVEDGRVSGMEFIRNELREADSSGRARPFPIPGSETVVPASTIIVAIGQAVDLTFMENDPEIKGLALTKWGTPLADEGTLQSSLPYLFVGGDFFRGPQTVIQAVADGRRAAYAIHQYLGNETLAPEPKPFNVSKGRLAEVDPANFEGIPARPREKGAHRPPAERHLNFKEVEYTLEEDQVRREAARCLSCGCLDAFDCRLRWYSQRYGINIDQLPLWSRRVHPIREDHPEITIDPNKCIACRKCVHGCSEYQVQFAVELNEKPAISEGGPPVYAPAINDRCAHCGLCAGYCPTGALEEKNAGAPGPWKLTKVKTTCTFCGVGCQLFLKKAGERLIKVKGVEGVPPNLGHLCLKGRFRFDFVHHPDRLRTPLIREGDRFREASWGEALDLVAGRIREIGNRYGPEALAALSSGRCTNEEHYLLQKMARAVFKTNNIDHYTRMVPSVWIAGLDAAFGVGAMTNSIAEIERSRIILVFSSDTTRDHPVAGAAIKRAVKNGARLIVLDSRQTELADLATLWLRIRPGTDVAAINGLMQVIVSDGVADREYIGERTEGFEALQKSLETYTPSRVSQLTGVSERDLRAAAWLYASEPAAIYYSLSLTRTAKGLDSVKAIANLAMLCGNVGLPNTGVNPLGIYNNVQGACDMGCLTDLFPGYQRVDDPEVSRKMARAWGLAALPDRPGLSWLDMKEASLGKEVRGLYILGGNPETPTAGSEVLGRGVGALDLLVVQNIFMTETAKLAHVVLPGTSFAEKDGTFTNTERRVQRVRQALQPVGRSKPDWQILSELSTRLGYPMFYAGPEAIFEEIRSVTPFYAGITYPRIEERGLQWPCPTEAHPGTPFLHRDRFTRGLGKFQVIEYQVRDTGEEGG